MPQLLQENILITQKKLQKLKKSLDMAFVWYYYYHVVRDLLQTTKGRERIEIKKQAKKGGIKCLVNW
jgi:ferritin-like protein